MYQTRFQQRSVLSVILLTLITCGIYEFYWIYKTTEDLGDYTGDHRFNPGMAVLFTIITCGLYSFYWWYQMAQLETRAQQMNGRVVVGDNKILYLVLAIFSLSIVNMAILQSDLNAIYASDDQLPPTTPNNFTSSTTTNSDDENWTEF